MALARTTRAKGTVIARDAPVVETNATGGYAAGPLVRDRGAEVTTAGVLGAAILRLARYGNPRVDATTFLVDRSRYASACNTSEVGASMACFVSIALSLVVDARLLIARSVSPLVGAACSVNLDWSNRFSELAA